MSSHLTRRSFLKAAGICTLSMMVPKHVHAGRDSNPSKPNIIFLMTDDMGIGDTTVYNPESKIPTPYLEKLASKGVVFTDAHSPSSMCTPTRYALLTGRYCWRTWLWRGVYGGYDRPLIKKDRMTIASLLKENGYATACVGKWHLGMDWATKNGSIPEPDDAYE